MLTLSSPHRNIYWWLPIILTAVLMIPYISYTPDDTYIHAQYAKQVMSGGGFSFNRGEPTYGSTSPLWVFLIALGSWIWPDHVSVAKLLSAMCTLGAIAAFAVMARSIFRDSVYVLGSTLAWSVDSWLVRWGASGMETSLSVLLLLTAMIFYGRERKSMRRVYWSMVFLALLTLVRPEAFLLFGLILMDLVWMARRRPRDVIRMAGTYGVLLLPWILYAAARFGTIIPHTFSAKSTISSSDASSMLFSVVSVLKHVASNRLCELALLLAGIVLALKDHVLTLRRCHDARPWLHVAAMWMILLPVVYILKGVPIVSRYLLLVTPFIVFLGFQGLASIQGRLSTRGYAGKRGLVLVALIIIFLTNSLVSWTVVYPHTRLFSRGMRECLIPIGRWFARETPPQTSIAALDIGALGYYSEREVLDLGGLVTPQVLPWLKQHTSEEMAEVYPLLAIDRPRADYIVYRSKRPDRLGTKFAYYELEFTRHMASLGIDADPGETYYSVYRIVWDKVDNHRPWPEGMP